jgi:hypothetical protein
MKNKQFHPKKIISSICHRHHFSNPNTAEIVFSLLLVGVVYRLIYILGRSAKY